MTWCAFRAGLVTHERRFYSSEILVSYRFFGATSLDNHRDGEHGRAAFGSRRAKFCTKLSETPARHLCFARL
jgi:hypothetical protein